LKHTEKILAVIAVVTLAVAYAAPVFLAEEVDYLPQLQAAIPEADELVRCSSDPLIYRALAYRAGEKVPVGYVGVGSAVGYEGTVVTAVACDLEGNILAVTVLEHTEWATWFNRVEEAGFIEGFAGRKVTDALTVGEDIDAVTSATFTSRGIADGVREAAHAIARSQLDLPVKAAGDGLSLTREALAVLGVWAVAVLGAATGRARLRWVTMAASLVVIGFWLAAPLSLSTVGSILLGRVPPLDTGHLVWYVMVVGILGTILVFGRNIYCYWVCPFGAIQELLAAAGGGGLAPGRRVGRVLRLLRPVLLWGALLIAFVTRSPSTGSYEPFATLFTFTGTTVRWTLLIFVLVLGILSQRFWCRHLCATGYAFDLAASWRRKAARFLRERFPREAHQDGHRASSTS